MTRLDWAGFLAERFPHLADFSRGPTPEQEAAARARAELASKRYEEHRRQRLYSDFTERRGDRYAACSLEAFEIDHPQQQEVVSRLQRYCADFPGAIYRGQGLVLFGGAGTGKDFLLVAISSRAILEHGIRVEWWSGLDLFAAFRAIVRGEDDEDCLVRRLSSAEVLYLSDPLPPSGPLTEFQASLLLRIVEKRYSCRRPCWVTLNVASGREADERLTPPIADRLREQALCLHCCWPSYRRASE